jgi:predicted RNA-binding Zn-ribbon protein involved in translation (DUF1610 family)
MPSPKNVPLSLPMVRLLAWLTTPHGARHARDGRVDGGQTWSRGTIKNAARWGYVTIEERLVTSKVTGMRRWDDVRITPAGRKALKARGELPPPKSVLVSWCTTCGEPILADREEVDVDCPRCPTGTDNVKRARFVLDEGKEGRRGR